MSAFRVGSSRIGSTDTIGGSLNVFIHATVLPALIEVLGSIFGPMISSADGTFITMTSGTFSITLQSTSDTSFGISISESTDNRTTTIQIDEN